VKKIRRIRRRSPHAMVRSVRTSAVPRPRAGRLTPRNPSQRAMWSMRKTGTRMIPMCMRNDEAEKIPVPESIWRTGTAQPSVSRAMLFQGTARSRRPFFTQRK
jgi:hypothetical protein